MVGEQSVAGVDELLAGLGRGVLAGRVLVAPIGIPAGAPEPAAAGVIEPAVLDLLPRRGAQSTKFSSGQVTIIGGSRGLTGAVSLAAMAAIRTGAGYATVAVPADLERIFEVKLTEVMSIGCASRDASATRCKAISTSCFSCSAGFL